MVFAEHVLQSEDQNKLQHTCTIVCFCVFKKLILLSDFFVNQFCDVTEGAFFIKTIQPHD